MAVNVSPRQLLEPDFIDLVDQTVARTGIDHADLELEITERQVVEHMNEVEQTLQALTARGVRIAIDDFGTGYSSLAYLMQLSVQTVKIDRAFMAQIPTESRAGRIVTAIIAMAQALGLTLTAEGIETHAQHQFLLEAGCELGQGFGFARPQNAEAIKQYL
jgi:EAL domain-containing protein (putative c-di-GMP-specific phosphodiesterase class I)